MAGWNYQVGKLASFFRVIIKIRPFFGQVISLI